jgi:hypothetical protein
MPTAFRKSARAFACLLLCAASATFAEEVAVIESSAPAYEPGKTLDSANPLVLAAEQFVVIATEDGRILRLEGPRNTPLAADLEGEEPATAEVIGALARLVGQAGPEPGGLAGVRGEEDETPLDTRPEAWLIHTGRQGNQCFLSDAPVELWRELGSSASASEITDVAGGGTARVDWAGQAQRAPWPASLGPVDGRVYLLRRNDAVRSIAVTLHVLPPEIDDHELAAVAWLAAEGCARQARLLLAQVRESEQPQ